MPLNCAIKLCHFRFFFSVCSSCYIFKFPPILGVSVVLVTPAPSSHPSVCNLLHSLSSLSHRQFFLHFFPLFSSGDLPSYRMFVKHSETVPIPACLLRTGHKLKAFQSEFLREILIFGGKVLSYLGSLWEKGCWGEHLKTAAALM